MYLRDAGGKARCPCAPRHHIYGHVSPPRHACVDVSGRHRLERRTRQRHIQWSPQVGTRFRSVFALSRAHAGEQRNFAPRARQLHQAAHRDGHLSRKARGPEATSLHRRMPATDAIPRPGIPPPRYSALCAASVDTRATPRKSLAFSPLRNARRARRPESTPQAGHVSRPGARARPARVLFTPRAAPNSARLHPPCAAWPASLPPRLPPTQRSRAGMFKVDQPGQRGVGRCIAAPSRGPRVPASGLKSRGRILG